MTQETASLIFGHFNALRIATVEHVGISRSQLIEITAVRINTANIDVNTPELYAMRRDLADISRLLSTDFQHAIGVDWILTRTSPQEMHYFAGNATLYYFKTAQMYKL